jgi:uncharacterized membrane protein
VVRALRGQRPGWPLQREEQHVTERGVTINRPPEEVFRFLRERAAIARALAPDAEAELLTEEPPRQLRWRVADATVAHEGRAELTPAPADRGTELRVQVTYPRPAASAAVALAALAGTEPDQVLRTSLRRVKQLLECGEVVTVDGQPSGRGRLQERLTEAVGHRLAAGGRP